MFESVRRFNDYLICCDTLANHVLHRLRQRSIAQRGGLSLAVIEHPVEESDQGLALGGVVRVGRDQQPGKAGDRIGVRAGGVRDRDTIVGRHGLGRSGSRSRDTVGAAFTNLPAAFFTAPKDILFCTA